MNDISACIVTFNRKYDLIRCVDSVLNQSKKPSYIFIYDNASTDGTLDCISNHFSISIIKNEVPQKIAIVDSVEIWYFHSGNNSGGAGGFHNSLKYCHEEFNSDFFWLMDDDGFPEKTCLELLFEFATAKKLDYVMPVSIDIDNYENLSWPTRTKNGKKVTTYIELKKSWGEYMDYVTPFNGALLSRECVSSVGYVNKNFFIWGDEYEHYWRCKKKGIFPVTKMDAVFYHPAQKLPLIPIMKGLINIPYVDSPLRMTCLARNYTHIYMHYDNKIKIPASFLLYTWLYLVTRKLDIKGYKIYCKAVSDGLVGNFTRHLDYL